MKQLFIDIALQANKTIAVEKSLSRRLSKVLRYKQGEQIALFNGCDGRFAATIVDDDCRQLMVNEQLDNFAAPTAKVLLIAMLKRDAMTSAIRQATELGITHIQPVKTDFCVADKLNLERATALIIEAAEQCERLDLPQLLPTTTIAAALKNYPQIFWAAERTKAEDLPPPQANAAVLIGPEGGFSPNEKQQLAAAANIIPITLGQHVLRADTAVVAACAKVFN